MLTLLAFVGSAVAADPADPAVVFGKKSADFIFVLDSSQGLLPMAESLRAPISELVRTVPEGDRVAVVAVHTRATAVLPPTPIEAGNRQSLIDQIKGLSLPSAKETDLGAGAAEVIEILGRKGASPITFVVVVSDFCHNPSVQSPYDSGGRECRSIRGMEALSRRFRELTGDHIVVVDYLPVVRTGSTASRAPTELQPILGKGRVDGSPVAWLQQKTGQIHSYRYRPVAEALLAAAKVQVAVTEAGTPNQPAKLRLDLPEGIQAQLLALRATGGSLSEQSVLLAPSGVLNVQPDAPAPDHFSIFPRRENFTVPVTLTGELQLEPAAAWTALGVEPVLRDLSWTVEVPGSRTTGSLQRTGLLLASVLAGGAAVYALRQRSRQPPMLEGSFSWRRGGDTRLPLDIGSHREIHVHVLPDGSLGIGSKQGSVISIWKVDLKNAFVETRQEGIEINSHRVAIGRHSVIPGATSFQFGEYRLTWE